MRPEIDLEQARSFVQGIDIPVRPAVLQHIMELQSKGDPDINAIAKSISGDVSLSAGVLKTINSPLFGMRKTIGDVRHAVALLGLSNVINIVVGISLRLEISGKFNVAIERFWDTANDVALIASGITKSLGNASPDMAYTLGLFHDCGIPLLIMKHENYIEILKEANAATEELFTEVEDRLINTNHTAVGYYVAKSWCVPKHICMGILNHHEQDMLSSDDSTLNNMITNLKMAEAISHSMRRLSVHAEWDRIKDYVLQHIGLSEQEYSELREDMSERLNETA